MIYIKKYNEDEGAFHGEISGYLAHLSVDGKTRTCFVSGDADCLTIGEIINACGYTTGSVLGRRLIISIKDEI